MKIGLWLFFGIWLMASVGAADIAWNATGRVIEVTGFPDDAPATMDVLLAADRRGAWGVVHYEPSNDTYTVQSSLFIGNDQDRGTYVQIGRPNHLRETVVVHGNVWIKPARKSVTPPTASPAFKTG